MALGMAISVRWSKILIQTGISNHTIGWTGMKFLLPRQWSLMVLLIPDFSYSPSNRSKFPHIHLNISTVIGCIAMKLGTHIRDPLRMKCENFGNPLTLPPMPHSSQNVTLTNALFFWSNTVPLAWLWTLSLLHSKMPDTSCLASQM